MGAKSGKEENKATKPTKSKSPEATSQQDPKPVKGVVNDKLASANEPIINEDTPTVQDFLKNDKWVKRIDGFFSTYDVNKDGYISREDWIIFVDKLEKTVPDRPDAIAKVRKCMSELLIAFGLTNGVQADKKEFRELAAAYCLTEAERMKRGEMTKSDIYGNAVFDVVDTNHDGCVTFEEYKVLMDASNLGEEEAKAA